MIINNIEFYIESNIRKLKTEWDDFINPSTGNPYYTYFYNYSCYKLFKKHRVFYEIKRLILQNKTEIKKIRFIVGKKRSKIVCILPLFIDDKNKKITFLSADYSSGSGYNDIISGGEFLLEDWNRLLSFLSKEYIDYIVNFVDVSENSNLPNKKIMRTCVKIILNTSHNEIYDEWYNSLTKNARQNLRTAYNRLHTDNKKIDFVVLNNIKKKEKRKFYELLVKRSMQKNGVRECDSVYRKIKNIIDCRFSIVFYLLSCWNRAKLVSLEIDNCTAAFMILYETEDGVVVPKLVIDSEFSRYSPGWVMIAEYIKRIEIDKSKDSFIFDLSRGDEQYKLSLGGKQYFNYGLNVKL